MTFAVHITSSGYDDMEAVCHWLVEQGTSLSAERWISDTMESIQALDSFPERCPVAPEASGWKGPAVRQLLVGQYRVVFAVEEDVVFVLMVRHGMRDAIPVDELMAAWNRRARREE